MSSKETLKILLMRKNMKLKKLAEELTLLTGKKYTAQSISSKMTRSSLNYDEMELILQILGYRINIVEF